MNQCNEKQAENSRGYESVFLARQPVFSSNLTSWAYELLYRANKTAVNAIFTDHAVATLQVLGGLPLCPELTHGNSRNIINFPAKAIIDQMFLGYPTGRTVIQLSEFSSNISGALVPAVQKLKKNGYAFSINDFKNTPEQNALCELADYISIDMLGHDRQGIETLYLTASEKSDNCKLIAKRIEEYEDYYLAKNLGFDFFQGFFFQKPELHQGKKILSHDLSRLKLFNLLQNENVEFHDIKSALVMEVSIVHRLLLYINSSAVGLRNRVKSIEEALVIMGLNPLKKWLQIMLITDVSPVEKPIELVLTSAQRACFFEKLAQTTGKSQIADSVFLLGLFSLVDAIMDHPMENLLDQLSFELSIRNALLKQPSTFLPWLSLVEACEKAQWEKIQPLADELNTDNKTIMDHYAEANLQAKAIILGE